MMKQSRPIFLFFFCLFLVSLLLCWSPTARAQEVEDEREFSYEVGSENGPEHWGDLHKEWAMCKNGNKQSPIDMKNERVEVLPSLGRLTRRYKASDAKLKNRGHDIMLEWTGNAGSIHINGTDYFLKQSHWHSPSEHTINGKRFDMEVHLVHQSSDKKIAVVGIMYKRGRPDPFLSEREEELQNFVDSQDGEREVGVVDPRHIKLGSRKYYRYLGSLTTPPCTQGVVWTITRKVRTVSKEQLRLLREAVHDQSDTNARPTQPTNKRTIHFYRPWLHNSNPSSQH